MHNMNIDLETYSSEDITKTGSQRYIASPDFEILLFGFSVDDSPVYVIDLERGEIVPQWVIDYLHSPEVIKHAYNAAFEYGCLEHEYGGMDPSQWRDTMLQSLYCGFTAGLGATGNAMGLAEDKKKLQIGKDLIRYFCKPCKPTKSNGGRTRNYPEDAPEKWALFKEYNRQDVVTEKEIGRRLSHFLVPDFVQKQWETDLQVYMRGVNIDKPLVDGALKVGDTVTKELTAEAKEISGLQNPNSVQQLSRYFTEKLNRPVTQVTKQTVSDLLSEGVDDPDAKRMLEIRQELGKTSTKKYQAIENCICPDGRVRGLLQFYGANRSGRWAGRLLQVQNLPQTHVEPLDFARQLTEAGDEKSIRMVWGSPNNVLSQLIRTALIPTPGNKFVDADFSAIEARVISWLAGETWRLDVFRTHGKIYEASASQMFNVPIEKIKKGNPEYALRAKGKVAELALGYQGGVGALINMGALSMGLDEEELPEIVEKWRTSNPHIAQLWTMMNNAALSVIQYGGVQRVNGLVFAHESDDLSGHSFMTIKLPSGRKLFYVDPAVGVNRFGSPSITYTGIADNKSWGTLETYGGKLTENCIQAIARDCLAEKIEQLDKAGYPIVFHVHDEVIIDIRPYAEDEKMLQDVVDIMRRPVSWAPGLPLNADGWVGDYYTKD